MKTFIEEYGAIVIAAVGIVLVLSSSALGLSPIMVVKGLLLLLLYGVVVAGSICVFVIAVNNADNINSVRLLQISSGALLIAAFLIMISDKTPTFALMTGVVAGIFWIMSNRYKKKIKRNEESV